MKQHRLACIRESLASRISLWVVLYVVVVLGISAYVGNYFVLKIIRDIQENGILYAIGMRRMSIALTVDIEKTDSRIIIRFKDGGTPFNPLAQDMPDTTLSWKLRRMGGLGIFLVIKKMDDVSYAYTDHQNVLTIEKKV